MTKFFAPTVVLAGALLAGGCATKKFVRNTAAPIQAKVDQVGDQTNKNTLTAIQDVGNEVKGLDEKAQTGISAAKERAMTAENRANDAMTKANEAGTEAATARTLAEGTSSELASLKGVVSNLDSYKVAKETSVQFAFGKYTLSDEAKAQLDQLVADKGDMKSFQIAVEGFTDRTGSAEYNLALSRQRAAAVVNYLVTKHDVPVYRIHTIGLGEDKIVDEGQNREARAKNRRVEVKIFSAGQEGSALASRAAIQ